MPQFDSDKVSSAKLTATMADGSKRTFAIKPYANSEDTYIWGLTDGIEESTDFSIKEIASVHPIRG